ncbi:MAG: agmatinase [Phycisphaeraceae bacterium]|nr:agmatinase [Phycisphaeraceae bacterium]
MSTDHRRTILPDARVSPRFAGIATFGRYPRIEDVAPDNAPVDWAIYGVPFDTGVTFRPGARFGPRAIRDASQYLKPHHLEHGVTITETLSLADAGDAPVAPYSCAETQELVRQFAMVLGEPSTTRLLALGGDHSIALANMRATHARRGSPKGGLACIHFDSHLDTVDSVWGEKLGHASPFIRAIEAGVIDPRRMVSVGIKGPLNTPQDLEFAMDHGVTLITYTDWCKDGPVRLRDFLERIAAEEAYLSFDIDVIDPAFAPGTGTPSVGGFSSAQAMELLRMCRGANIVGADVVEVLPDRDVAQMTAFLASHIAFEILSLDAVRVGGGGG